MASRAKRPTMNMISFANRILLGDAPSVAYKNSSYNSDGMNPNVIAVQANRLLNDPRVGKLIGDGTTAIMSSIVMTRQEIVERYTRMAQGEFNDLFELVTVEVPVRGGQFAKRVVVQFREGVDGDDPRIANVAEVQVRTNGTLSIKMHDQQAAMKALREMGSYDGAPKAPVGPDGQPVPDRVIQITRGVVKADDVQD